MAINVLMCGGRRAGKTSVLAGIRKNMVQMFPSGDIVLEMQNVGRLTNFQNETEAIFGYEMDDEETFFADQRGATGEGSDYACNVHLKGRANRFDLNFTDVPGEWFTDSTEKDRLYAKLRQAHVLVIAVDSPHLIEENGEYHEVFNRAETITNDIKKCFQGNSTPRMVLFVPVKSEKYRSTPDHPDSRMPELLQGVKDGYRDLINWLTAEGNNRIYTVAITPCFTFGGAEFLQFFPPIDPVTGEIEVDASGNPLQPVGMLGKTPVMQYLSEYLLLRDQAGMHYCTPQHCEQPLLYILLYLIAMSYSQGFFDTIWGFIRGFANNRTLQECKRSLLEKVISDNREGYAILSDPLKMLQ